MLDENLPAFILKPAGDGVKHHRDIYLAYQGNDPVPSYNLHHADPASPTAAHRNCYAAAIFDCYNPEVLYGEVLARPAWTQPTLSAEELRKHGGVPPPPQPILPNVFTIQLYNPDQQVKVEVRPGKWVGSDSYEFSMPQNTFRAPSASNIDRSQSDPASLATTPKIHFVWRRESKLSKDLTCYMTGRSTDTFDKRKARKDPDIAIALWRSMRELTIYEPNLQRVDIEDPKGLEVVLLLGAIVIKDLFFTSKEHVRELFNVSDLHPERKLSGGGVKLSTPPHGAILAPPGPYANPALPPRGRSPNDMKRNSLPRLQTTPPQAASSRPPPPADPRAEWELQAETARLRAQADAEKRELQRRRLEKERADEAERRRLLKIVEQEEKEARKRQAEIDKETERLRKQYGVQPLPQHRPTPNSGHSRQRPSHSTSRLPSIPQGSQVNLAHPQRGDNGLYAQAGPSNGSVIMSGANPSAGTGLNLNKPSKKKSFFGLRGASEDAEDLSRQRLTKKSSTLW